MAKFLEHLRVWWTRSLPVTGTVFALVTLDAKNNPVSYAQKQYTCSTQPEDDSVIKKWDCTWDRRDPTILLQNDDDLPSSSKTTVTSDQLSKYTPKHQRNLILIQHGNYNKSGDTDNQQGLTELGRLQANLTAERIKSVGVRFAAIVSSSLTKSQETAAIIRKSLANSTSGDTNEGCICPCNDQGEEETKVKVIPTMEFLTDSLLDDGYPCEPSPEHPYSCAPPPPKARNCGNPQLLHVDRPRIEAAFRKYVHRADLCQEDNENIIIVCHANLISYFVCKALQLPEEGWSRISLNHASITVLSVYPNGLVSCRCLGDSGHIPTDKISMD